MQQDPSSGTAMLDDVSTCREDVEPLSRTLYHPQECLPVTFPSVQHEDILPCYRLYLLQFQKPHWCKLKMARVSQQGVSQQGVSQQVSQQKVLLQRVQVWQRSDSPLPSPRPCLM